jgi:alcohol dehydrogenase
VSAAVVYQHGPRGNIVLEANYREPPLLAGWVRLRVGACSVNYHDIFSRRGMPGIKLPLPLIIGSDIAGEVWNSDPRPGTSRSGTACWSTRCSLRWV